MSLKSLNKTQTAAVEAIDGPVLIFAGAGSGITPLMSILKSILIKEPASCVNLFYGNKNEESIIE